MKNMSLLKNNILTCNFSQWSRYLLLITVLSLTACGSGSSNSENPAASNRGELISATVVRNLASSGLDNYLVALKSYFGIVNTAIIRQYNVTFYKITYKTIDTNGNIVNASGLVSYPDKIAGNQASPLLSFQHGTIFNDFDAPSNVAANPPQDFVGALFSSQGFVVVLPDYLGYGESTQLMHPYIIADSAASVTIDMLRAVRTHAAQISHALSSQLFITGYSEGGYVTLAAQKEMEANLSAEFTITKSVPAAGPYNISWTAKNMIDLTIMPSAVIYSFVMKSYDTIYGYGRISAIFKTPYAAEVNGPYYYGDATSITLTDTTADLLTPIFLYGPDGLPGGDGLGFRENGETVVKGDFFANDIYSGWTATTPTILYHGAGDLLVPIKNANDAVTGLGANVSLTACDATPLPSDHSNCVIPYFRFIFNEFGGPY